MSLNVHRAQLDHGKTEEFSVIVRQILRSPSLQKLGSILALVARGLCSSRNISVDCLRELLRSSLLLRYMHGVGCSHQYSQKLFGSSSWFGLPSPSTPLFPRRIHRRLSQRFEGAMTSVKSSSFSFLQSMRGSEKRSEMRSCE